MIARPVSARTRSRHDHGIVPGSQTATNIRASKERLPWASFRDKQVLTMTGWDVTGVTTVASREASRARLAEARATFRRTTVR